MVHQLEMMVFLFKLLNVLDNALSVCFEDTLLRDKVRNQLAEAVSVQWHRFFLLVGLVVLQRLLHTFACNIALEGDFPLLALALEHPDFRHFFQSVAQREIFQRAYLQEFAHIIPVYIVVLVNLFRVECHKDYTLFGRKVQEVHQNGEVLEK